MQKLLIANWKAHKNIVQAEHWLNNLPKNLLLKQQKNNIRLLVAPPSLFLSRMQRLIDHQCLAIELAVQDISAFGAGAFTGELAAESLEFLGVKMAIVGHSERRRIFHESSQMISEKIRQAQAVKLAVLLCVDETNFAEQAKLLTKAERQSLLVAYEPASAIGSGQSISAQKVKDFFAKLRQYFPDNQLLYGGSVKADNVQQFLEISDGVLVGGAALELDSFTSLLQNCSL